MENTPEVKVNITTDNDAPIVTILSGKAEPEEHPISIDFSGILSAPGDFLTNRKGELDPSQCRLEVDFHDSTLVFFSNEKSKYRDRVSGKLKKSRALETFSINGPGKWDDKKLAKLLRTTAFYFPDQEALKKLHDALMKFEAKVQMKFENSKDLKGNAKVVYEKTVELEIPNTINIKLPIFEGYEEKVIKIEVGAEATSSGVDFFLESQELSKLEEEFKRQIIEAEITKFKEFNCAVLQK